MTDFESRPMVDSDLLTDILFVYRVLQASSELVDSDSANERFMRIACAIPGVTPDMVRGGAVGDEKEIEPDELLKHFRPDEIAQCWEGVDRKLYIALWNCMDKFPPMPTSDDIRTYDRSVAAYWGLFTKTDQKVLNDLAERNRR